MKKNNFISKLLKWINYKKQNNSHYETPDYNIECTIKPKESGWTKIVAIGQIALATFTLLTLILYFNFSKVQNRSTERSLEISDSIMKNGIGVSQTELRPYLMFCLTGRGDNDVPKVGTYTANIYVKNFGKTPAYDVTYEWGVAFRPILAIDSFPNIGDTIYKGMPFLPPGEEMGCRISSKKNGIDKDWLRYINSGQLDILIFIRFNYNQHLGDKIINHYTQFSVGYDPAQKHITLCSVINSKGIGFCSDK